MTITTAASVSSSTHTGIYYSPAHVRRESLGRNIRLVNRDRLPALRAAYRARRRDASPAMVRMQLSGLLRSASSVTITPAGERIVGSR